MEKKFKNKSTLQIFDITGIEVLVDIEQFGLENNKQENYHKIIGEFIYCDLLITGKLIVNEIFLNDFINKYTLKFEKINCNLIEVSTPDKSMNNWKTNKFNVKFLAIENLTDDEEDDLYIFIMQNN